MLSTQNFFYFFYSSRNYCLMTPYNLGYFLLIETIYRIQCENLNIFGI